MVSAAPDLAEASHFLDVLAPGEHLTFQTFSDKGENPRLARILHGSLAQHADELAQLNAQGAGVFVTINKTDLQGRKAGNVTGIRALFVDLDGSPLEPVLAAELVPDIVVESSPGRWHCYWLIDSCPLDQFTPMQKALAARFNSDTSVHDLCRVLRLPGFLHQKSEPFRVRIVNIRGEPHDCDLI